MSDRVKPLKFITNVIFITICNLLPLQMFKFFLFSLLIVRQFSSCVFALQETSNQEHLDQEDFHGQTLHSGGGQYFQQKRNSLINSETGFETSGY